MSQAQTGCMKSTPKICRVNGDDNLKVIYRNLGNNHAYPFVWADLVTVASGVAEATVASGVKFHGYDLATYGNVTASPMGDLGESGGKPIVWYIEKNTTTNVVKLKTTASLSDDVGFDVKIMLGAAPSSRYIESIYCRGNTGAMQALP